MIEFTLGWPPSDLSPNRRLHWAKLAKAKKAYRHACWGITLDQWQVGKYAVPHGPLTLTMRFVPPDRRSYDRDNLVARMKSGLDGLCDALRIDDKRFSTIITKMSTDSIGGFVHITITGENDGIQTL